MCMLSCVPLERKLSHTNCSSGFPTVHIHVVPVELHTLSQSQVSSAICCLLMSHSLPLPCRVSASLPSGQLSNVPWRRTGVKYMHNEVRSNTVHCFYGNLDG